MGVLSVLLGEGNSIAGLGLGVFNALEETKRQKSADALKTKEVGFMEARERADAARAASEGARNLIWSNLIKGIGMFLAVAAGGVALVTLIKTLMKKV